MDSLLTLLKKYTIPDLTPGYLREFHEEVARALSDGKLTEQEIAHLEERKEELGLSDEAFAAVRLDMYAAAFQAATEGELVTEEEWDELEHIQDYLGINDEEIAKTKKQLYRMRILTELRKGNMPVMQIEGLMLEEGEFAHWSEPVEIWEAPSMIDENVDESWTKEGPAKLIITNKRILIIGHTETRSYKLGSIIHADCRAEGVILHIKARKALNAQYISKGNQSVVGSILLAAIEFLKKG